MKPEPLTVMTADPDGTLRDDSGARLSFVFRKGARRIYVAGRCPMGAIVRRYAKPGDSVGGRPKEGPSILWAGDTEIRGLRASWGVESAAEVAELLEVASEHGLERRKGGRQPASIAGLAARALRRWVPALEGRALGTPPRLRSIAHDALYQGPQVVFRGASSAPGGAVLEDQERAYLRGMRLELPDPGCGWTWHRDGRGRAIGVGALDLARCLVSTTREALPYRTARGMIWPIGRFVATVPGLSLHGAAYEDLREVLELARPASASRWLERFADRVEAIAHKALRRSLYTRAWGLLSAVGSWSAEVLERTSPALGARGVMVGPWSYDGPSRIDGGAPSVYQPAAAAAISASVAVETWRRIVEIEELGGRVIFAALDSVAWEPIEEEDRAAIEASRPPTWGVRARGPARAYGIGVHGCGSYIAAAGWDEPTGAPPATLEELGAWVARRGAGDPTAHRRWVPTRGLPEEDPEALSEPITVEEEAAAWVDGFDPGWSDRGWWDRDAGDEKGDYPGICTWVRGRGVTVRRYVDRGEGEL